MLVLDDAMKHEDPEGRRIAPAPCLDLVPCRR
jgi:hypothetical protein